MKHSLFVILLFCTAFTQFDWQDDGLPVRQGGHIEWQRSGAVGNDGEMIYVWSDTRNGVRDIFAQKIDVDGNDLWQLNGQPVVLADGRQEDPIIVSDDNGGAYIVWIDYEDEPEIGDVYAQHILSDGSLAWDPRGVALSNAPGAQVSPNICKDGQGGAYVIWDDRSQFSLGEIYATHISSDGSIVNPGSGVIIMNHFSSMQAGRSGISLETGGNGHAVLGWADDRNSSGFYEIYTQRIDQNCNTLLSSADAGGKNVCNIGTAELLTRHPRITYMNENIVAMVWEDYRNSSTPDVYLQLLDNDGNSTLQDNGIPISTSENSQYLPRIKADTEHVYVVWEDLRNHPIFSDVYAQKVSLDGSVLWQENGLALCTESRKQYGSRLTTDGQGGVYFVWSDERNANYPEVEVFVQHVSSDNEVTFTDGGLSVSEAEYVQYNPLLRKDGAGGVFAVWGDLRSGSDAIYGQHISQDNGVSFLENGKELYFDIGNDTPKGKSGSIYLGNDQTLIFWEDLRENPFRVQTYGKIIDSNYDPESNENGQKLSEVDFQYSPKGVKVGDNIFLLFESVNSYELEHLYYQVLDQNLNILNDPQGSDVYDAMTPQINSQVIENQGSVYVGYSDLRDWAQYDIAIQKFDSDGNPQWGSEGILISNDNDDFLESIVPLADGGCVVFWTGGSLLNDESLNIYYQAFDESGNTPLGWSDEPQILTNDLGIQNNAEAISHSNGIFVTWNDYQNGNADILAQFINNDGTITGPDNGSVMATESTDEYNQVLSYSEYNNEVLVVWEYDNGFDFDIKGCFVDLDGSTIGSSFDIASEYSDQTSPTAYASSNGVYMLMWRDGRLSVPGLPPVYDIYYQEIGPLGFNFTDSGTPICDYTYNQDNPRITLLSETDNSYLLFWNDMRSTGKQDLVNLYAQSVTISETECVLYDVNSDGNVDVLDIVLIVGIILDTLDPTQEQQCASDVNTDGAIDVIDIVTLVNYILE